MTVQTPKQTYRLWHPWIPMSTLIRDYDWNDQIVKGDGSFLYKKDGSRLLDGSAGIWNTNLGHAREDIIRSIENQLRSLTYMAIVHSRSPIGNDLAELLLKHSPPNLSRVMLHCTGTAAVESAVLITRQYFRLTGQPQRVGVISVDQSFHGGSFLGLNLSGYPEEAASFEPRPGGFYHIGLPDGDAAAQRSLDELVRLLETAGPDTFAAFVFEPIMAVAGVIAPPEWWTRSVIEICRRAGIKVIADEVTTGLGRAGSWFASASFAVDIVTLGKGLSAGYMPLAASLYSEEIFEPFDRGEELMVDVGSTMDGYPAACAAGIAVVRALEDEELIKRSAELGTAVLMRLKPLERLSIVREVSGQGLMIGVHLAGSDRKPLERAKRNNVIRRLLDAGLLLHYGQSTLTVFPPLTIGDAETDLLVSIMTEVLAEMDHEHQVARGQS